LGVNKRLNILRDFKVLLNREVKNQKELVKNLNAPDMPGVLIELQKIALENGFSIERMSPSDGVNHKAQIEIVLFGDETGLMKFLAGIENLFYIKIAKIFFGARRESPGYNTRAFNCGKGA